ncbi:hypothetical protein CDD81_3225 [Ophiocordyceps australis]|uniref:AAA+ ATPase domain-containing protein n=1 Tax=Ophiocordyceps australis TaxID=1399860 RepID=A0A2C5XQ58_9HYPO|nr:hypothetical protein CDD81_3225 [Ophiocordyceps australis]
MDSLTRLGLGLPPLLHQDASSHVSHALHSPNTFPPPTTPTSNASLPAGFMDTLLAHAGQASPLMQLLVFVYRQLGTQLGLDPSLVLTVVAILWGLCKLGAQGYDYAAGLVERHFTCAIYVYEFDLIYLQLMKWLSQQPSVRTSRYLMAQTVWTSAWDDDDEEEEEEEEEGFGGKSVEKGDGGLGGEGEFGERRYLNFSNQAARSGPRFVPAMGTSTFWHGGSYFRLHRRKEAVMSQGGWGPLKDQEELKISCLGRSKEPLKRLLSQAKSLYYHDTDHRTTIYRPRAKEQRYESSMWQQVARRPVRPMRTVVLDAREKHGVLADINEYLDPATPRWYAARGIPLRRGYLFHGPPGTGKTSFSFALAGVFGIDIYVISLQDVNVTEEDLAALFTRLPRRCIVLLEDIDTAGLRRRDGEAEASSTGAKTGDAKSSTAKLLVNGESQHFQDDDDDNDTHTDTTCTCSSLPAAKKPLVRRKTRRRGPPCSSSPTDPPATDSISLSGLLNAIDGVASHEGRVLIMTTNKPQALDEALIRPGRVDVQVAFCNATGAQATELFCRMYEASGAASSASRRRLSVGEATKEESQGLPAIAAEFGSRIPDGVLSPAEIQGFLLKRKTCPRRALDDVEGWVEACLRQKEMHSKVSTVQ